MDKDNVCFWDTSGKVNGAQGCRFASCQLSSGLLLLPRDDFGA